MSTAIPPRSEGSLSRRDDRHPHRQRQQQLLHGSTALFMARQAVESGAADCVLAVGFEQMRPGALGSIFEDRPSPFSEFDRVTDELVGHDEIPLALRYFASAGKEHMEKHGTKLSTFAKIRAKASRHAARNPLALSARS